MEVPADWYRVIYVNNVNKGTAIITGTGQSYGGKQVKNLLGKGLQYKENLRFWKGVLFYGGKIG